MFRFTPLAVAIFFTACAATDSGSGPSSHAQAFADRGVKPVTVRKVMNRQPLLTDDIVEAAKKQVPTATMVSYVRSVGTVYTFSDEERLRMLEGGVPDDWIVVLSATGNPSERTRVSEPIQPLHGREPIPAYDRFR